MHVGYTLLNHDGSSKASEVLFVCYFMNTVNSNILRILFFFFFANYRKSFVGSPATLNVSLQVLKKMALFLAPLTCIVKNERKNQL